MLNYMHETLLCIILLMRNFCDAEKVGVSESLGKVFGI